MMLLPMILLDLFKIEISYNMELYINILMKIEYRYISLISNKKKLKILLKITTSNKMEKHIKILVEIKHRNEFKS